MRQGAYHVVGWHFSLLLYAHELNCLPELSTGISWLLLPRRGQKHIVVPYNIRNVYGSLAEVVDFDRGFFVTLIKLFTNPKVVIDTYLSGNTKRFSGPFRYFITFLALGTLISLIVGQLSDEVSRADDPLGKVFPYLLVLPTLLFFSTLNYVLYKGARNFVEHLIMGTYEVSQFVVIVGLLIPLELVDKSVPILLFGPAMLCYILWFNYANFGGRKSLPFSFLEIAILVAMMAFAGFLISGR